MKSKVYLYQFLILLVWIGVVMMLFKLIPSKQVAAVFAGIGFIVWPILFFLYEWNQRPKNKVYLTVLAIFLLTNALPIFLLRIFNWGIEFSSLSLFGIPAEKFHGASNVIYMIMMLTALISYFRARKSEGK